MAKSARAMEKASYKKKAGHQNKETGDNVT